MYTYCFYNHEQEKKCFLYLSLGSQTTPTRQAEDTLSQRFPVSREANNELMFSYMRPSKRQNYETYLFFPTCGGVRRNAGMIKT